MENNLLLKADPTKLINNIATSTNKNRPLFSKQVDVLFRPQPSCGQATCHAIHPMKGGSQTNQEHKEQ